MDESAKILKTTMLIEEYGGFDGGHHKQWVLDQAIRLLVDDYDEWIRQYENGEEGPNTYEWDVGTAP